MIGIVLYIGSRRFAPAEEAALFKTFGTARTTYANGVRLRWL